MSETRRIILLLMVALGFVQPGRARGDEPAPLAGNTCVWIDADAMGIADRGAIERVLAAFPSELKVIWTTGTRLAESNDTAYQRWQPHRDAIDPQLRAGDVKAVFEVALDVNRLRREREPMFAEGRATDVLNALGLGNAREIMLHGRLVPAARVQTTNPDLPIPPSARETAAKYVGPPLLAVELTWSSRADKPGVVRRMPIAASYWPASQMEMAASTTDSSKWIAVVRMDWFAAMNRGISIYSASLDDKGRGGFEREVRGWTNSQRLRATGVAASFQPWLALSPEKGAVGWRADMRGESDARKACGELSQLLGRFGVKPGERSIKLESGWWPRRVEWMDHGTRVEGRLKWGE